jgi:hypothetical protein
MEENINTLKMKKIKNIIFDLGGVIMNLDVPRTIKAFDKIGIKNIVNDTGHNYHHSFFTILKLVRFLKIHFCNHFPIFLKNLTVLRKLNKLGTL